LPVGLPCWLFGVGVAPLFGGWRGLGWGALTEARQVRPHRDYCSVLYSVKALSEGDSWDEVSNESVSIFLQITQLLTSGL
jgi:hypothetical protein